MFIPNTIFCVFILKKKNAHEFSKNSFLTQYFENCFHMKNKNMNAIIKQTLGFQCKTSFFFSNEKKKENLIDFLLLNLKKKRVFRETRYIFWPNISMFYIYWACLVRQCATLFSLLLKWDVLHLFLFFNF